MSIKVRIIDKKSEKTVEAADGAVLMDVIRDNRFYIEAPCGGNGKCKKCTVNVEGTGDVLSCLTRVAQELVSGENGEIVVRVPERGGAVIKSLGLMPDYFFNPIIKEVSLELLRPEVSDQLPDDRRLTKAAGASLALHLLPQLPGILRNSDFKVDCLIRQDIGEIIHVRPTGSSEMIYGISVDIG
ncbi:MAG: 2Fe-2S iron-sulfur cluster-binding protein, partial [Saccharofermentanales bacterium]